MRFYHFAHSSASYRVRIVLALKGIEVDYRVIDMFGAEQRGDTYAALNPQKLLPCLELADGTIFGQSLAIIDYLEALHPTPALLPDDPAQRAVIMAQALMIACDTAPLQAKLIQRYLADPCGVTEPQIVKWVEHWIRRGLEPVDEFLADRRKTGAWAGGFAGGETPGLLDVLIVPQLRNCARFGLDVSDLSALQSVNEACLAHPAFQAAHPDLWI